MRLLRRLAAFVLLTFNTFVNDFFGICRGYGLSLGLLMTGLYYQYCSFTAKRALLYESLALLFSAAAVLANYTLFNFFLLHAAFNLLFTKPIRTGEVIAEGRWISGRRRVFIAEAHLTDAEGDEIGRGTGTFMRSHIALAGLAGYRANE